MRELILERIKKIKSENNNFSRSLMKWRTPLSHGTMTKYADEINYEELPDSDLLFLFERILRRHYAQY